MKYWSCSLLIKNIFLYLVHFLVFRTHACLHKIVFDISNAVSINDCGWATFHGQLAHPSLFTPPSAQLRGKQQVTPGLPLQGYINLLHTFCAHCVIQTPLTRLRTRHAAYRKNVCLYIEYMIYITENDAWKRIGLWDHVHVNHVA